MTYKFNSAEHYERFWGRYEAGEWEPHTKTLIEETLQPGDLFVDIGAWIGPVTLWALERGANVIAVEPDPVELRRRVPASVEIWEGAVATRSGIAGLTGTGDHGRAFGTSMSRLDEKGKLQVQTWTLPEILAGRIPALVKVDIEGYEIDLLPEIAPYLAAADVPMQVALHGVLPERDWFAGYGEVRIPATRTVSSWLDRNISLLFSPCSLRISWWVPHPSVQCAQGSQIIECRVLMQSGPAPGMDNLRTGPMVDGIKSRNEGRRLVELLAAEYDLKDLPFVNIHDTTSRPGDIEAALQGRFRIHDEFFRLDPPVDWWDRPYRAPGEHGFFQNSFVFADSLLSNPRFPEVLNRLAVIFADWLSANPQTDPTNPHPYAWHDHAAAGRLVVMTFVLREGVRRKLIDQALAETLAAGILEHVTYLLDADNYAAHYNHGMFGAAALALAARSLTPAPQTAIWTEIANDRFTDVLTHTVDGEEALHLEHSPDYHWTIHGALSRFSTAGLFEDLDLATLVSKMEESGAWILAPDGTLPPLGDTSEGRLPPRRVREIGSTCSGLRAFPASGYVAIHQDGSALIVTAAHHRTAHKHADDGSFCLYEDGLPIVVDSGNPSHDYKSSERHYGASPAAHSTICIDGYDWSRAGQPYGSGLLDTAEQDGLYAVLTHNPEATPEEGSARRIILYAPQRFLVVIDDVRTETEHVLTRYLPLAHDLSAALGSAGDVEIRRESLTVARLTPFASPGAEPEGVELVVGRLQPEMAGFDFPVPAQRRPRCDIILSSPTGQPRAFALTMGTEEIARPTLRWTGTDSAVECEISGVSDSPTELIITGSSLELVANIRS